MALPVTITGLGNGSRPFLSSSGNVYIIGSEGSTNLAAYKATDPTSSFSNVGTDVTTAISINSIDVFQVGDVLHVVTYLYFNSDNRVIYHTFNMSSDSWTISNETVKGTYSRAFGTGAEGHASITVRSDGDVIVLYPGEPAASMGTDYERAKYARREGGTWTIDVAVDNAGADHWYPSGTVMGSSDRMHFFLVNDDLTSMYQRTLTSANALEAFPSAFDSTVHGTPASCIQSGTSYDDGGTQRVRFPVVDATAVTINSAKLDSGDAPTVTQDTDITGATGFWASKEASSFSADGTTLWHTFVDNSTKDIFTQSNADDGGWSTPASFYTTTGVNVKTNVYTRGTSVVLAMVIHVGSDAVYHEKTLSTTGSTVEMDATASVTWSGSSTAATNLSSTAAASLTWNGTGLYPAAWSSQAAASLTWDGASVAGATEADWSSAATASVTWGGTGIYPAAFDQAATASQTWNGASTAAVAWQSDAVASLTWNGASTATSDLSATAAASLTWAGSMVVSADWSSTAAADLTWNGAAVAVSAAAFDMAATASLTWNGSSLAYSAWSSQAVSTLEAVGASTAASAAAETAAALLTWNGASSATSAWFANATAAVTWAGTMVVNAAWSSAAAASVTWNGASVATVNAAFDMAAAASLTWNGAAVASTDWSSASTASQSWNGTATASSSLSAASLASLTWNGTATAASAWAAAALAVLTWEGDEVGGAFAEGAVSITAAASVTFTSATISAAAFQADATASATFTGTDATASPVVRNLDGWRIKHQQRLAFEEVEEEDIIVLSTALYDFVGFGNDNY